MKQIDYELIRSKRRTISLHIKPNGNLIVRAPLTASENQINRFVISKEHWIDKWKSKYEEQFSDKVTIRISKKEIVKLKENAATALEERCAYFSVLMGVTYGKIKINGAKTRWGSCNSRGDINFTYRLMFAEPDLVDYIVVHELAHRKEMNHSARFWNVVKEVLPDYKLRRERLGEFQYRIDIIEEDEVHEDQQNLL